MTTRVNNDCFARALERVTAQKDRPVRKLTAEQMKKMADRAEAEKSPLHRLVEEIHKGSPENTFSE